MKSHRFRTVGPCGRAMLAAAVFSAWIPAPAAAQQLRVSALDRDRAVVVDEAVAPAAAPPVPADQTPQETTPLSFFKRVELSGFVDTYYSYNFNTPGTRQTALRNFDAQHNSFNLSLAEVSLEKRPTAESRGGFHIDLDYGPTAATVHSAEPGGTPVFQNIGQAYLSYLAPVGTGLQVDVGEFLTPIANKVEVIKTTNDWNYSRSWLFSVGIPYYHAGLRANYAFSDRIAVTGYLVNGWNNAVDNNTGKTVALQATLKPLAALTVAESYMGGPEQQNNNSDWRHVWDTQVIYTARPGISVAGVYDLGQDTLAGATVRWQSVAGYLRYQPNAWFALSPRFEYYNDRDGFTTGAAQKLKDLTITGELKHKDGVVLRVEYRHDVSDVPFFLKNATQQIDHQDTFTVGLVYAFSSKAP